MKIKTILFIIVQTFFFTALSAQTTQEQADKIVLERMSSETQSYTVYAKEDVQKEMIITSAAGEMLELDYSCWIYYIRYGANQGRYLIVNKSNGNLLEVDAKSGAEPEDLAKWKEIEQKYFACGVKDPLQNIEWLREFCESLNEIPLVVRAKIDLYKVIDSDEHFFKIGIYYRPPYSYGVDWKNCTGELIIHLYSGVPPSPELEERYNEFLKNKEYVAELFNYVMPVCGVSNPLQNIKWLKEYCESLKERQDISSARIALYESKDGYVFQIWEYFPYEYASNKWVSSVWKNCAGDTIFPMFFGWSPPLELCEEYTEFLKDKVSMTDIFEFVKQ